MRVTVTAGEVKLNYLSRQYFVTMGLFLMAVLLPFNTTASLTFRDLCEVTQLEDKDLVRHIQQLVDIKLINTTAGNVMQLAAAEVNSLNSDTNTCISLSLIYCNESKNLLLEVLCIVIMVHNGTRRSYRSVDWIGL